MKYDDTIYLDFAAATPLDEHVLAVMTPYMTERFYNPTSPYAPAVEVRRDYEDARHRLAVCIGGRSDEIVLTAGATESINLAFASVSGHVVVSAIEHPAVLAAARLHDCTEVPVDHTGLIDMRQLAAVIRPDTQLVSVALANNEIGTVQRLRDIATIVQVERDRRRAAGDATPIWLHTDASQCAGQVDIQVSRLGVDAMTLNAGKVYGPKQVGLLWADRAFVLKPQIVGGGQERGLRSGTENVAGVIGFAAALERAVAHRDGEVKRLAELRDHLQQRLLAEFPDIIVSGHRKRRLANFLPVAFEGLDAERLLFLLESRGVFVATGSACAANKGTGSHVLRAIGLAPEVANGSLRITLGRTTTPEQVERAATEIIAVVRGELQRTRR